MDKEGRFKTSMDETVEAAEKFYRELYRSQNNQNDITKSNKIPVEYDLLQVATDVVKKALEEMQRRKAASEDKQTDVLKHYGETALEKWPPYYEVSLDEKNTIFFQDRKHRFHSHQT